MRRRSAVPALSLALALAINGQGVLTTVAGTDWIFPAGGAVAPDAPVGPVVAVTVNRSGEAVFADPGNAMVFRITRSGTIQILAGNGIFGFSGEGGPATAAALNTPQAAVYDSRGNLYIADTGNNRIRRVSLDGSISTVAGTGVAGFAGDGGPASAALLNSPGPIAIDQADNLYFIDRNNFRIRRISPQGGISTVAGTGRPGFSGDNGPAPQAALQFPEAITVDTSGNLYIADTGNHRIRRVSPQGVITTLVGTGQAGYSGDGALATNATLRSPGGIAIDVSGNISVSDTGNYRIRRISAQGTIQTIAGTARSGFSGDNGPAAAAALNGNFGLAVDSAGNLLLADRDNFRIRAITPAGTITTLAGNGRFRTSIPNGPAANAFFFQPQGVAAGASRSYWIADSGNNYLHNVAADGTLATLAGTGVRQYTGNNVVAATSPVANPIGVAVDSQGNVYFADTDNHVVRRLTPGGTLVNVAGTGSPGFSGDNGPATAATLRSPFGVAVDTAGALYIADTENHRIRRVSPQGVITTFAGSGQSGFSGDQGSAATAALQFPVHLAFDRAGNLVVADSANSRIRRITPAGVITTIAGGGRRAGPAADGNPAIEAALGIPFGLTFDANDNLYFSDATEHRIRRVSPTGVLTTVAGGGQAGFAGDGGPPSQAMLSSPRGLAWDATGNLLIADMFNHRIRAILSRPVTVQAAPASLQFAGQSGGPPASPQLINISTSLPGFAITSTSSVPWLRLSAPTSLTPAILSVTADPANLPPGTHSGTIALSSTATPVTVTFTVSAPDPPKLSIDTTTVTFAFTTGTEPAADTVLIRNSGGTVADAAISVRVESGGDWLKLSRTSVRVLTADPASVVLTATPAGLASGTYKASLVVSAPGANLVTVPVVMTLAAPAPRIRLSQTALTFTAVAGAATSAPQQVLLANAGTGTLTWSASVSTLGGGSGWVRLPVTRGEVSGPDDSSSLPVTTDGASLPPGEYYARIDIRSAGAVNSPQTITVILNVLPPNSNPGPQMQPSSLVFVGPAGESPSSQTVTLSNLTGTPVSYSVAASYSGSSGWLQVAPSRSVVLAARPVPVVVQPDFRSLPAGVHESTLAITFDDGAVRTLPITAIVTDRPAADAKDPSRSVTATCDRTALILTAASPGAVFTAVRNQAVNLDVRLLDNCGSAVTSGASVVAVPEGEGNITLVHAGQGRYTGVWQPRIESATPRKLVIAAYVSTPNFGMLIGVATPVPIISRVIASASGTFITPGAVVNGASFAPRLPVAPGSLISVFGERLADAESLAGAPLPTALAGTEVTLGEQKLPLLFTSSGQLNAMIPFDLPVNTQMPLHVQRGASLSYGDSLTIAAAQPAVFTRNQQGTGQGAIVDGVTNVLADEQNPVAPGRVITIYCTGLGQTSPAIVAGESAPLSVLSRTVLPVTVEIGGRPAPVTFSGLAPGFAGLYQVNAEVPTGLDPNPETPLTLTIAGQTSPAVTFAVK